MAGSIARVDLDFISAEEWERAMSVFTPLFSFTSDPEESTSNVKVDWAKNGF